MKMRKTKHKFKSKTLPTLLMVGPVTAAMLFLVAIPLIYVVVMSFCSIDEFYNIQFHFTMSMLYLP